MSELIGVPEEAKEAVAEAIARHEDRAGHAFIEAVTESPLENKISLEKWGVKLRDPSLMQLTLLGKLLNGTESIPPDFHPYIWIWSLGAPLATVYKGQSVFAKSGQAEFLAMVQDWWDKSGIPTSVTQEVLDAVTAAVQLIEKISPKQTEGSDTGGIAIKKNISHGQS